MARPRKENHPITIKMRQDIYDKLDKYCEESGLTKTSAIERAILMYVTDYEEKMEKLKAES